MDDFELEAIYEDLMKTLPGATGGAWDERDPLIGELKSRSWWRRKQAIESPNAKLHHILMGLRDKDARVAVAAVRHPLLEPDMLRVAMGHDNEAVRRAALQHPKLPLELIDQAIGGQEERGDLDSLMENPSLTHRQLTAIEARSAAMPDRGYGQTHSDIRSKMIAHPGFDSSILNQMALQSLEANDGMFLESLAESKNLEPDTISAILARGELPRPNGGRDADHILALKGNQHFNSDHLTTMLQHPNIPDGIKSRTLQEFLAHPERNVLNASHLDMLLNPPDEASAELVGNIGHYPLRNHLMNYSSLLTPELVRNVMKNPFLHSAVQSTVLKNTNDPEALATVALDENATSNHTDHREEAAIRFFNLDSIPPEKKREVADQLMRSKDYNLASAASTYASPEALDAVARLPWTPGGGDRGDGGTGDDWNDHIELALKQSQIPPDTLRWAAQHEDAAMRFNAARNTNLPADVIPALLRDSDEEVRAKVLNLHENKLSENDLLFALESDLFDSNQRRNLFKSPDVPHTPATFRAGFYGGDSAGDAWGEVAHTAAEHPRLPPEVAYELLDRSDLPPSVRSNLLQNTNVALRPTDVDKMLYGDEGLERHALDHPSISKEDIKRFIDADLPEEKAHLKEYAREKLIGLDPDLGYENVQVRYGTAKLRKIRDEITKSGAEDMKPNKLGNLPGGVDWNQMRLPNGNISAKKIQAYIDAMPASRFNVGNTSWDGMQRHSNERQKVFQLNLTTEMLEKLRDANLYSYWRKVSSPYHGSHPVTEHTVGWVRYTGKPEDGLFMDEIQSDFHSSPHARAMANAKRAFMRHRSKILTAPEQEELNKELAETHADATTEHGPEEQHKQMLQIIFGNKHPHEVLHEAFAQHLRDKGHAGTKIAIHSAKSKAPLSGWDEDEPIPVHGKIAYEDYPKKMGFQPASYTSDNMPTMSGSRVEEGAPVWQDELHKYENLKEAIRKLIMVRLEARNGSEE